MSDEKKQRANDWGQKTLGQLVTENYRRADVFEKNGMDFCCGGAVALETACR